MAFTIKDLENLTGIKAHTLRIWEQRYSFLTPSRSDTNIRYYSNEELKVLLNISLLNKHGYKISKINKMSVEEIRDKIYSLDSQPAIIESISNELIKAMVEINLRRFDEVLEHYIKDHGIKDTILNIIYPFLDRIGILWLTENINPAQEHLVSNVIRQKIIVGIDQLPYPKEKSKKACLFLPEGEFHELTLLFIYFLIKNKGLEVVYIGASAPLKDVLKITQVTKPDFLYTHITTAGKNFNFERFVHFMDENFKGTEVFISGNLSRIYENKIPRGLHFKRSLEEVLSFIDSL